MVMFYIRTLRNRLFDIEQVVDLNFGIAAAVKFVFLWDYHVKNYFVYTLGTDYKAVSNRVQAMFSYFVSDCKSYRHLQPML